MKILFIGSHDIFGKIDNGGVQCSKRNHDLLVSAKGQNELYTAIICNEGQSSEKIQYFRRIVNYVQAVKAAFFLCRSYPKKEEKKIISYITEINPDILFLDTSMIGNILKKIPDHIFKIVFFHNVEKEYAKHRVNKEGFWYLPSYFATCSNEKTAMNIADVLVCLNDRDAQTLSNIYDRKPEFLFPISFKDCFNEKMLSRNTKIKKLLFVGSFFPPNYKSVKWFVEEVMEELKEFELYIVGRGFESKRKELERKNVIVIGTVDNLEEYYYSFTTVVIPILYGDGMKVKTAEALMYGSTIFATDEALEGYHVEGLDGTYRCNSKDDFVTNIRKTYELGNIKNMNQDNRNYFLKHHDLKEQISKMEFIMEAGAEKNNII